MSFYFEKILTHALVIGIIATRLRENFLNLSRRRRRHYNFANFFLNKYYVRYNNLKCESNQTTW